MMINPAIENDLKNMSLNDVNYAEYIKENYIQIPDNATNGDVIKAIFPDIVIEYWAEYSTYNIEFPNDNDVKHFSYDWWNSPYNEVSDADI